MLTGLAQWLPAYCAAIPPAPHAFDWSAFAVLAASLRTATSYAVPSVTLSVLWFQAALKSLHALSQLEMFL